MKSSRSVFLALESPHSRLLTEKMVIPGASFHMTGGEQGSESLDAETGRDFLEGEQFH
jgi:hypothetical protein